MKKSNAKIRRILALAVAVLVTVSVLLISMINTRAGTFTWSVLRIGTWTDNRYHTIDTSNSIWEHQTINTGTINTGITHFDSVQLETGSRLTYGTKIPVYNTQQISLLATDEDYSSVDSAGNLTRNGGASQLGDAGSKLYWCPVEYDENGYCLINSPWRDVSVGWTVGQSPPDTSDMVDSNRSSRVRYIVPIFRINIGNVSDGSGFDTNIRLNQISNYKHLALVTNPFQYTFKLDGGSYGGDTSDVTFNRLGITKMTNIISDPYKAGYDFKGWKIVSGGKEDKAIITSATLNEMLNDDCYYESLFKDATFVAQWTPQVELDYDDRTINSVFGAGKYNAGDRVEISAVASSDCQFTNWSFVSADGGTTTNLSSRNYYLQYDTNYGRYVVKSKADNYIQPNYTGLVASVDGGWWYCRDGYVDFNYTGLACNEEEEGSTSTTWWFVHNGKVEFDYNEYAINSHGLFKCSGGKVDFNATEIATSSSIIFYMPSYNIKLKANGKNNGAKTLTLLKDENIGSLLGAGSYDVGAVVSINATAQTNASFNNWTFISAGGGNIVNNTSNQYYLIYDSTLKKFVVKNKITHQINSSYSGIVESLIWSNGVLVPVKSGTGEWWMVQNGAVSYTYTGLVANEDGVGGSNWWFVHNGTVEFDYNGYAINSNGIFKCSNGKVDLNATNIGTTSSMSFYMPSYDVTLKAIGTKNPDPEPTPTPTKYTVTVKGDSHNKVEGTSGSVTSGTIAYATATFNNGYQLDTIEIKTATGTNTKSYWDWTTKGNYLYDKGVMVNVTSDTEITIKSKPIDYNITYNLNNGSLPSGKTNPTTYNIETDTITLVNPERSGYEFTGWTGTGLTSATKTVTIPKGSTGDKEYKANWKQLEVKPATVNYTVEYYLQNADGTYDIQSSDTLSKTGKVGDIIKDKRKSYDSTKYLTPTSKSITLSSDTTKNVIQYYYNRTTFNVAVSNGTGTSNATHKSITDNKKKDTYRWGESVQVSTDVNTGYTWDKWTSSDVTGSSNKEYTFTMPVKNVTLTASATINSYSVTYKDVVNNTDGEVLGTTTSYKNYGETVKGSDIGDSKEVSKYYSGYEYVSCTEATVTTNVVVYRIFKLHEYTVTVAGDDNVIETYGSGNYYYNTWAYTSIDMDTGYELDYVEVTRGNKTTKQSYWDWTTKGDYPYDIGTKWKVTDDIDVLYHTKKTEYILSVDPAGGSYLSSKEITEHKMTYKDVLDIRYPVRSGYVFMGWEVTTTTGNYDKENKQFTMGLENSTLKATWRKKPIWYSTITKLNGDSKNSTSSVDESEALTYVRKGDFGADLDTIIKNDYIKIEYSFDRGLGIDPIERTTDTKAHITLPEYLGTSKKDYSSFVKIKLYYEWADGIAVETQYLNFKVVDIDYSKIKSIILYQSGQKR